MAEQEEPQGPETSEIAEGEPAAGTEGAATRRSRFNPRRLAGASGRVLAVAVIVALVVAAGAATIGVEVVHALSSSGPTAPVTTTTTIPSAAGGGAAPTTTSPTSSPSPSSTTTTTTPPQTGAPTVPTPGGARRGHGSFNAVSCTSATRCLAVGADGTGNGVAAATANGGGTWTTLALPGTVKTLKAVSCATGTRCVAVGVGAVLSTTNRGSSWTLHTPPADTTLLGVTCPTKQICLTTGVAENPTGPYQGVVLRSTDGGSTWTPVTLPTRTPGIGAVTCPTASRCVAVGAAVMTSNDAGATWTTHPVIGGVLQLSSVSCPSATHCIAVGPNPLGLAEPTDQADAVVTTDGGSSWKVLSLPKATAAASTVACAGATTCFVGGGEGQSTKGPTFVSTTDGGSTWASAASPQALTDITGLTCPTSSHCVVVGRSGTQPVTAKTTAAPTVATSGSTPPGSSPWQVTAVSPT